MGTANDKTGGGCGTVVVDASNRVVELNREAALLLGVSRPEALHRPMEEIFRVRDAFGNRYAACNEALHAMARDGEEIQGFTLQVEHNGTGAIRVLTRVDVVTPPGHGGYNLVFSLQPDRRRQSADLLLEQLLMGRGLSPRILSDGHSRSESREQPALPRRLTRRQAEVLGLVAGGMNPEAISERLNLSVCTVRRHLQMALGRLDAHSQAEAVATALRHHLI